MNYSEYKALIKSLPKPEMGETEVFISMLLNDHSWYKHLSSKREIPFVFYLDPNGGRKLKNVKVKGIFKKYNVFEFEPTTQKSRSHWQYYTNRYTANFISADDGSIRDSRPYIGLNIINESATAVPLPQEAIEIGTFMMSRYIHEGAFKNASNYFDDEFPKISFATKHEQIIEDLRTHLNTLMKDIYEH